MTDTQLTIVLAGIPPTLVALGTLVATIINGFKSAQRGEKVEQGLKEVHGIVNSKSDKSDKKIEALETRVADLMALLAEKKETASLLAQASAIHTSPAAPEVPAPVEVVVVNEPHDPVPTTTSKKT